jgi:predicted outer membrane repeat protein
MKRKPPYLILMAVLVLLSGCNRPGLGEEPTVTVVYVNAAATGSNTGSSWKDAFTSLQTALQNTGAGQVWVARGTYTPGSDPLALKNNVAIYGGFAGSETSLAGRNWEINATILDGEHSNQVVVSENTDATAVLDGFTVQNGHAREGGGLYNNGGSPTLRNLVIANNAAPKGGGMYSAAGSPRLDNITFTGNLAVGDDGGGFYNDTGSPVLNNVSFGDAVRQLEGNTAKGSGGGMYSSSGDFSLTDVAFYGNVADLTGGGLYVGGQGSRTLDTVRFYSNHAQQGGGGLYNASGSLTITGASFGDVNMGNTVGTGANGGGIYNDGGNLVLTGTAADPIAFHGNAAEANGGGLYHAGGTIKLTGGFTFEYNTAAGNGGGVYSAAGDLSFDSGSFSSNTAAGEGGGVYAVANGTVELIKTNFAENAASSGSGGGLHLSGSATVTLSSVQFKGNTAHLNGGGLFAQGSGTITLESAIFENNSAGCGDQGCQGLGGGFYNSGNRLAFKGSEGSRFTTNAAKSDPSIHDGPGGGGLYHEGANATLYNVSFSANTATLSGGGMYASGSETITLEAVTFTNNVGRIGGGLFNGGNTLVFQGSQQSQFIGNRAIDGPTGEGGEGGGLAQVDGSATISNVAFSKNTSSGNAGGVSVSCNALTLENVSFEQNSALGLAGGLSAQCDNLLLDRGSFVGNQSGSDGGGGINLYCSGSAVIFSNLVLSSNHGGGLVATDCSMEVANATVVNNVASSWGVIGPVGGGLWFLVRDDGLDITVANSIFWNNQGQGRITPDSQVAVTTPFDSQVNFKLEHNLIQAADPLFVCPPNQTCSEDLQLRPDSPAIDKGDNSRIPSGVTKDLAGHPRIVNNVVDQGAYEYQGHAAE